MQTIDNLITIVIGGKISSDLGRNPLYVVITLHKITADNPLLLLNISNKSIAILLVLVTDLRRQRDLYRCFLCQLTASIEQQSFIGYVGTNR